MGGVKNTCLSAPSRKLALDYLSSKFIFGSLTKSKHDKIRKEIYKEWKK
jgi:hypothetical protein